MPNTDDSSKGIRTERNVVSPNKLKQQSRTNKLKQIDAIYKSQIQQIYKNQPPGVSFKTMNQQKSSFVRKGTQTRNKTIRIGTLKFQDIQNISTSSRALQSVVSQGKIKATKYTPSDTQKTTQLLRVQNQNKQGKIRDLTSKCQYLLQKLRGYIGVNQLSQEIQDLDRMVENKVQRFDNLFRIKSEETFYKAKFQVISLLQQMDVPKSELGGLDDIRTESSLFTFMARKVKGQLKSLRSREQESNFELQKDRVINSKFEERVTYLTETNQLLKMSEQKSRQKNDTLKAQMHEFLGKMREKQIALEQSDSQVFRLKRQIQELQSTSAKNQQLQRRSREDKQSINKATQTKEKEYKALLNTQSIQKQRLHSLLQEKDCLIEEMVIKEKYLAQQNQRIGRQLLRVKERFEWSQKQLVDKRSQLEQQKSQLMDQFRKYKENNNQSMLLHAKAQTDQAMQKVDEYQQAYNRLGIQLEEERRASKLKHEDYIQKLQSVEQSWLQKTKRLQKIRQEQLQQISQQYEQKHQEVRKQFQRKQKLVSEELQAKMKTLLAQKDRKTTQKLIQLEQQNQEIKIQLDQQKQLNSILQNKR